jgi:protein-S-isoprenylcysteine O-methyltransferase Ste14
MKSGYFIVLGTYLAGLAIRTCYEILKKSGKVNPKSTILFIIVLLGMCSFWISWFAMCPLDPLKISMSESVRWFSFGIFLAGLVLAVGALIQLRGVENINHLVTTGLFSKLRHPMYVGFIFWIFGWATYHGAGVSFIAGLVGIGNIFYWRHLEEIHLKKSYGDKYLIYCKQTWF